MTPFATLADLLARFPEQVGLLAADETTGERDDIRIVHALEDASTEILSILVGRYSTSDLASLDEASTGVLRVFTMDVALYRISVSFARTSEALKERYDATIARLRDIARGIGALTVVGGSGGGADGTDVGPISAGGVVLEAPERMMTRERFRRI